MATVKWGSVPPQFHYLMDAVESCGETRVQHYDSTIGRHRTFLDTATKNQMRLIGIAKTEVESRNDRLAIERWCEDPAGKRPSIRNAIWYVQGLLFLFDELDGHKLELFDDDSEEEHGG